MSLQTKMVGTLSLCPPYEISALPFLQRRQHRLRHIGRPITPAKLHRLDALTLDLVNPASAARAPPPSPMGWSPPAQTLAPARSIRSPASAALPSPCFRGIQSSII